LDELGVGLVITEDSYLFIVVITDLESEVRIMSVLVFARECYYDYEAG